MGSCFSYFLARLESEDVVYFICFGTSMTFLSNYMMVSFKTLEHGCSGEATWGVRLGTSSVGGTIHILSGIESGNIDR